MGLYKQQKNYAKKKALPKNCDLIIAKATVLISEYSDKLSIAEKKELLDILKTVERRNQHLPFEQRNFKYARLKMLVNRCRSR